MGARGGLSASISRSWSAKSTRLRRLRRLRQAQWVFLPPRDLKCGGPPQARFFLGLRASSIHPSIHPSIHDDDGDGDGDDDDEDDDEDDDDDR